MSSVTLRRWQHEALSVLESGKPSNFLAVATPGAGKTTFALVAAVRMLAEDRRRRLVVVAPTAHLKTQWAESARKFGVKLLDKWDGRDLPPDVHGVATTYQQVAVKPGAFASVALNGIVIFDEVHHAGVERAWGDACLAAFNVAARRLALSGTPFRTDSNPIPFINYTPDGVSIADVTYGYADGLTDRVVRPLTFEVVGGDASWVTNDGTSMSASMEEVLAKNLTSQRLRTAVSSSGDWLPTTLRAADAELSRIRDEGHPDAGALALAIDLQHARHIASLLQRINGEAATVILSDDPDASNKIDRYSAGRGRWLVAVRMVSEGVDVPRLRVGVWATTTSTELFFRQAVGRLVRTGHGPYGPSTMFLPRDPRLVSYATGINDERSHELKPAAGDDEAALLAEANRQRTTEDNLYEALGALPGEAARISTAQLASGNETQAESASGSGAVPIELPSLVDPSAPKKMQVFRSHRELRGDNAEVVKRISKTTGIPTRYVNAELNRYVGVRSVSVATTEQLAARLAGGKDWLRRAKKAPVAQR